jgi:hypothetical protein
MIENGYVSSSLGEPAPSSGDQTHCQKSFTIQPKTTSQTPKTMIYILMPSLKANLENVPRTPDIAFATSLRH